MKKYFCFPILMAIFCLCFWNDFCFLDTLKSLDLAGYSVFCDEDISLDNFDECLLSGGVKIYTFSGENIWQNDYKKDAFCEQVFMTKNAYKNYIKNNDLIYIKNEQVEDIKITYYLCKKLPKLTHCLGQCYNIVIAERCNDVVIGYPAIMGSL